MSGGCLGETRNDLKASGRQLTNRSIYNYFKECIIVKSHKLAEIIRKHCVTVEFTGDLEESVSGIFCEKIPSFLTKDEEIINPYAIGGEFGSAGVYDGSAISFTRNQIPC